MEHSGLAVQRANVRFSKLGKSVKELKAIIEETGSDAPIEEYAKKFYPEWETMTQEEFENKQWYIKERLLPLVDKDPKEVYESIVDEEQAKLLDEEEVVDTFGW